MDTRRGRGMTEHVLRQDVAPVETSGYLKACLAYAHANGQGRAAQPLGETLSTAEVRRIQGQLWALLERQVRHYTFGDSASVQEETAERLLGSVCYHIGTCLKGKGDLAEGVKALRDASLETLFLSGQRRVAAKVSMGKVLLEAVNRGAVELGNLAYQDTLASLGAFFSQYDARFFAQEIPCMIDYQLCQPVCGPEGIDFILTYLRGLERENRLIGCFARERVVRLLEAFCPDYRGQLINLYEPVAANALGLASLGHDVRGLRVTPEEQAMLRACVPSWTPAEVAGALLQTLGITGEGDKAYAARVAGEIQSRMKLGAGVEGIFIAFA